MKSIHTKNLCLIQWQKPLNNIPLLKYLELKGLKGEETHAFLIRGRKILQLHVFCLFALLVKSFSL